MRDFKQNILGGRKGRQLIRYGMKWLTVQVCNSDLKVCTSIKTSTLKITSSPNNKTHEYQYIFYVTVEFRFSIVRLSLDLLYSTLSSRCRHCRRRTSLTAFCCPVPGVCMRLSTGAFCGSCPESLKSSCTITLTVKLVGHFASVNEFNQEKKQCRGKMCENVK